MADETEIGSAGSVDRRGHPRGSAGEQSPLQTRAAFLKNRSWEFVISYNAGACARGGAQHGFNREAQATVASEWEEKRTSLLSLDETLEFLRHCHRSAPFLFFNGNTFADIGRQMAAAVFAELPTGRRRQLTSAIAHYIAGVLDREIMVGIVESLCASASLNAGDRVQTMRGSLHGKILRVLDDGRIVWQPDATEAELIAMPESLVREEK
jgi:hypothetical protein